MKSIIKVLLFMLTVVLLSQCEKEMEPKKTLQSVTIPDNNFLNALIELGVDTNGDSIISLTEADALTFLDVRDANISDMSGIEAFTNLDTLICIWNQLTSLDVSNNTTLTYLDCYRNQLTSLDVSDNIALELLSFGHNRLISIDVSNNFALNSLYCSYNRLTSLDVSNNTALILLSCRCNYLTTLDISNNTDLEILGCRSNYFTTLDVSNNTALILLYLRNMPSLYQVCVWEMPFPPAGVYVSTTGSPNVYFTTDCN